MRHNKPTLTAKEVADELGYCYEHFRRILKKGKIKYHRDSPRARIVFWREDVDDYLSRHTFGGTAYK
jgi:excisionase family DNA binding protein